MNELGVLKDSEFPSIKYSLFCGEPLTIDTAKSWLDSACNSSVENLYGPTEATISITKYNFTKKNKKLPYLADRWEAL